MGHRGVLIGSQLNGHLFFNEIYLYLDMYTSCLYLLCLYLVFFGIRLILIDYVFIEEMLQDTDLK